MLSSNRKPTDRSERRTRQSSDASFGVHSFNGPTLDERHFAEEHVQREPDRQIEDDADDRGGDGGERRLQPRLAV